MPFTGPRSFFFQAEDGIRDYKVTGVQTCALPIFYGRSYRKASPEAAADDIASIAEPNVFLVDDVAFIHPEHRSEERRVGKECRTRWWAGGLTVEVGDREVEDGIRDKHAAEGHTGN